MSYKAISNGTEKALITYLNIHRHEAIVEEYRRLKEREDLRTRKGFLCEDIAEAMMIAEYGSMEKAHSRLQKVTEQLIRRAKKCVRK